MAPETERYVATRMVERWLNNGYKVDDIPLLWNQGHAGQCSKGINKQGVTYNSCDYKTKVLSML